MFACSHRELTAGIHLATGTAMRKARLSLALLLIAALSATAHAGRGSIPPATPHDAEVYPGLLRFPNAWLIGPALARAGLKWIAHPGMMGPARGGRAPEASPGPAAKLRSGTRAVRRVVSSIRATRTMMSGDDAAIQRESDRINALHKGVAGRTVDGTPGAPAGSRYAADSVELQTYVLATLVDSLVVYFDTFGSPLSADERDVLTRETFRRLGSGLSLRGRSLLGSYAEVQAHITRVEASDVLGLPGFARKVSDNIGKPRRGPGRKVQRVVVAPALALLPPTFAALHGHTVSARERKAIDRASRIGRRLGQRPLVRRLAR